MGVKYRTQHREKHIKSVHKLVLGRQQIEKKNKSEPREREKMIFLIEKGGIERKEKNYNR
jgi:hypothetical protein